jgi:4'-phosphopantetheinyl transferase
VIHLWLQRASELPDLHAEYCFSRAERVRADTFRSARARTRFQTSHAWLRDCLAALLDLPSTDVPLHVDDCGAPALPGTALQVSLSHHGDWLALAASTSGHVGVDVLTVPADADFVDDTDLVLSPQEITLVKRCPHDRQGTAFALCWARKEAYAKMRRTGLTSELPGVTLTPRVGVRGVAVWSHQLHDAVVALATPSSAMREGVILETAALTAKSGGSRWDPARDDPSGTPASLACCG